MERMLRGQSWGGLWDLMERPCIAVQPAGLQWFADSVTQTTISTTTHAMAACVIGHLTAAGAVAACPLEL